MTYSFADVAERLMARFEGQVPLDMVVRVAREVEADLSGAGGVYGEALGEQVEARAGKRLADLVAAGEIEPESEAVPSPRNPS